MFHKCENEIHFEVVLPYLGTFIAIFFFGKRKHDNKNKDSKEAIPHFA